MKKYQNILFDLDGTLTDSGTGITNAVAYALEKFGIFPQEKTELFKFIGPPLRDSFKKYFSFSEDESIKAVNYYREYYKDKGIFENFVYDGINELLIEFKKSKKNLVLATSKPEVFARIIIKHFKLEEYFDYIAGSNLDGTRTKKIDVIEYAMRASKIQDTSSTIMVGDREHDILGAKSAGIDSIGVLYGFGSRSELQNAHATYIAENVSDIKNIILNKY